MRKNAKEETYILSSLFGMTVLFTDDRIDRNTVPEGLFMYEIRHSDEDWGQPVSIEDCVTVNFFGTVIFPVEIPVNDYIPLSESEYGFCGTEQLTIAQYFEIRAKERFECMGFLPEKDNVYPLCDRKNCPQTKICNRSAHMIENC